MKQSTAFLYEFLSYAFDGLGRELIKDMIDNALNRLTDAQQQSLESYFNTVELEAKIKDLKAVNERQAHRLENQASFIQQQRNDIDRLNNKITSLIKDPLEGTEHGPRPDSTAAHPFPITGQRAIYKGEIVTVGKPQLPHGVWEVRDAYGYWQRIPVQLLEPLSNGQL